MSDEHAARARAARLPARAPHDDPHRRHAPAGSPGRARTRSCRACCAGPRSEGLDVGVVGSGSNLLVADLGFAGLALKLDGPLAAIEHEADRLLCGGGARLPQAAARAAALGLSGIEFGVSIPGTVGGAVRMNANAYGGELGDVLEWVDVCTAAGGRPPRARTSSASPTAARTSGPARSSRARRSRSRRRTPSR